VGSQNRWPGDGDGGGGKREADPGRGLASEIARLGRAPHPTPLPAKSGEREQTELAAPAYANGTVVRRPLGRQRGRKAFAARAADGAK